MIGNEHRQLLSGLALAALVAGQAPQAGAQQPAPQAGAQQPAPQVGAQQPAPQVGAQQPAPQAPEGPEAPSPVEPQSGFDVPDGPSAWVLGAFSFAYTGTGFGVLGYFQLPVVPDGVLHSVPWLRDVISVEAGLAIRHHAWNTGGGATRYDWSFTEVSISATGNWNFWFTPQFAAYPRIGVGFGFGSVATPNGYAGVAYNYGGLHGIAGAGVIYRLGSFGLRAELDNRTLAVGVGLTF